MRPAGKVDNLAIHTHEPIEACFLYSLRKRKKAFLVVIMTPPRSQGGIGRQAYKTNCHVAKGTPHLQKHYHGKQRLGAESSMFFAACLIIGAAGWHPNILRTIYKGGSRTRRALRARQIRNSCADMAQGSSSNECVIIVHLYRFASGGAKGLAATGGAESEKTSCLWRFVLPLATSDFILPFL